MKTPHKHAELIKAWADGAEIQVQIKPSGKWYSAKTPSWNENCEYRITPEPQILEGYTYQHIDGNYVFNDLMIKHSSVKKTTLTIYPDE